MPRVQPTTTLNVDGAMYEVEKMSDEIKGMITLFDDWREQEAELSSKILMARHALTNLQNQLLAQINKEREEAMKKAEAMGITPPAPAPAETPAPQAPTARPGAKRKG